MMSTRKNTQTGMTALGMMILISFIGAMALLAMKIVPIYLDYSSIDGTLMTLKDDPTIATMSRSEITKSIQKRFDIGFIESLKAEQIKMTERGGELTLDLDYEDRRNIVANLDVIVHFKKTYTVARK